MATSVTSQIKGVLQSLAIKAPVHAVSSTNLTLSGWQTVGGVDLESFYEVTGREPRVLALNQDDPIENGIYDASGSGWTRSKDFDGNRDVVKGTLVTTITGALYRVITDDPIIIDQSEIEFQFAVPVDIASEVFIVAGSTFTLSADPGSINVLNVSLDGAVLEPHVDYTLAGTVLTLTEPLLDGQRLLVKYSSGAEAGSVNSNAIIYDRVQAEIDLDIVPVNFRFPVGSVERYVNNAVPGTTDMTEAFNTAVAVMNNWLTYDADDMGHNDGSTVDYARGGEVTYGVGPFRITSPILTAPNVALRGVCYVPQYLGSNLTGAVYPQFMSRIIADFPGGENWYMIDTGNWRKKDQTTGDAVTPYRVINADDQFHSSLDKDNWTGTMCPGVSITNTYLDGNSTAFGYIRMQMWFYGRIDQVSGTGALYAGITINSSFEFSLGQIGLYNQPMGLFLQGCQSYTQSGGEMTIYCQASGSWVSGNQTLINNVFYAGAMGLANRVNSSTWYDLKMKGVMVHWSGNGTFTHLAVNSCNIGVELYRANLNILHWENEFITSGALFMIRSGSTCVCDGLSTKSAVPLSTGDAGARLIIRHPFLLQTTTTFTPINGESTSTFEVQIYDIPLPDGVVGQSTVVSTVNVTRLYEPRISSTPFSGDLTLWVSSAGTAAWAGLFNTGQTTLEGALRFIENNPHIRSWTVLLKDAQTHTMTTAYGFKDKRIKFIRDFSGASVPTLTFSNTMSVQRMQIELSDLNFTFTSPAFDVEGANEFMLSAADVTIPASGVIWRGKENKTGKVIAGGYFSTLRFGASSGLCAGNGTTSFLNYEDSLTSATTTGTPTLEAITSGYVTEIVSEVLP